MELRHYKLLQIVVKTGSLTNSAEVLNLSQSALSHQLREIEEEYKCQVFTRANKKLILTPVGERLLQTANKIFDEITKNDEEIKRIVTGHNTTLRISTHCYTFYHWLAKVLKAYNKNFNKVDVEIITEATYDTIKWLEAGKLDLVIINFDPENKNINLYKLFDDELCVVVKKDHPLAGKKIIEPHDLLKYSFYTYQTPQVKNITYKEVFEKRGLTPVKTIPIQITEAILEMVKVTDGFTILSKWAIKPYLSAELKFVKLSKTGIYRKWYAATLKYKTLPPHFEGFIKALKENYQL